MLAQKAAAPAKVLSNGTAAATELWEWRADGSVASRCCGDRYDGDTAALMLARREGVADAEKTAALLGVGARTTPPVGLACSPLMLALMPMDEGERIGCPCPCCGCSMNACRRLLALRSLSIVECCGNTETKRREPATKSDR